MNRCKSIYILITMLSVVLLLLTACGDSTEEFCNIASASTEERGETEVDEYYDQLEAAAPTEIQDDIATLGAGWKQVSFSIEEMLSGNIRNIQRPPEVSAAARNVLEYVHEVCGFDGGVYLVFPEAGL